MNATPAEADLATMTPEGRRLYEGLTPEQRERMRAELARRRASAGDPFAGGPAPSRTDPFAVPFDPRGVDDGDPGPGDEHAPSNATATGKGRRAKAKAKPADTGARIELELADLLVLRAGRDLRYCGALGGWFTWTGTHWERDELERARELVKDLARDLVRAAETGMDDDASQSARRAGSAAGVDAILSLARSTPGIVFRPDDANRDPWLLNCANGTIDLRIGELRAHDRDDLITRCSPAAFDAAAEAPMFDQFLAEVLPPDVRAYLSRLFGCAAVGLVREHVIGVLWGSGANGKSVLADVVMYVLGDYAKPGPSSLIVANGSHEPHPTDVASCVGSRLVVVHETKRGACFDASKVKLLTGGDTLTARHMRQDFFTFRPSHTLIMLSNYRPEADATDAALWRRVQLVPFEVVIPEERRDVELAEKLRAEAPGVLRWIVEGAREWQRVGLAPPDVVREQTESYRSSEDVIGAFLEERTARIAGHRQPAGVLYGAFKEWCTSQGSKPVRGNDFSAELIGRGFRKDVLREGAFYMGIMLCSQNDDGDRGES